MIHFHSIAHNSIKPANSPHEINIRPLVLSFTALYGCSPTSKIALDFHRRRKPNKLYLYSIPSVSEERKMLLGQIFGLLDYSCQLNFRLSCGRSLVSHLYYYVLNYSADSLPFTTLFQQTAPSARRALTFTLVCLRNIHSVACGEDANVFRSTQYRSIQFFSIFTVFSLNIFEKEIDEYFRPRGFEMQWHLISVCSLLLRSY